MLTIGLASGLGNCCFMLPAIKALTTIGQEVELYVQTDFPTVDLWKRCVYAKRAVAGPGNLNGNRLMAGEYAPPAWKGGRFLRFALRNIYDPVWESNLRMAQSIGYQGGWLDVSDWCRDLDRTPRWDVGIVPGCKGGYWIRKRWPGLKDVAHRFLKEGRRVAVFGLPGDDCESIPGEFVWTPDISKLPDALAGCRVVIGGDSGVVHLASSLGIPVVMVYTATSEYKADPIGPQKRKVAATVPCHPCVSTPRWPACRDWRCLEIDRAAVIRVAEEFL